jgi:hypothetical protein
MDLSPFWSAVKSAVEAQLAKLGRTSPEEADLKDALERVLPTLAPVFNVTVDDALKDAALRTMLTRIAVNMQTGTALIDRIPHAPWVDKREINWGCWLAYEGYLFEKGFPGSVVRAIRDDTHRILELLGDPKSNSDWDRRGLVLGHVQSGKTSNYAGLISRAADAGYKLFIVIAGIHENLRNQTQQRIDSTFVELAPPASRPISLTTPEEDFSRPRADQRIPPQGVGTSLVLVVKKNARILTNLLTWLRDNSRPGSDWADMPLLLIDDEADNASINTNKDEYDPTRINGLIRAILNIFKKSSYVGYTATPFANIFIDPERNDTMAGQDLFPRNFIYCLEAPDNYLGPDKLFMEEPESFLQDVDDAEGVLPRSHRSTFAPDELPGSLLESLKLFLLACAIRTRQGASGTHMSMLVNVSPYAAVQRRVCLFIQEKVEFWRNIIKASAFMPGQDTDFWAGMQALFEREYSDCGVPWRDIRQILPEVVQPIKALVINSKSPDRLNYSDNKETGLKVIAVGGYTLSRGLTLENLMISYWNRNSKAYDTLMQMGRWFGYRDDYEPLCRILMPADAQGWYAHIAEASMELRADLLEMSQRGMTPEDFGLKVRNHPESLIITARNKMRAGKSMTVRPDLGGKLIETHVVWRDAAILSGNLQAMQRLVQSLKDSGDGELQVGEKGSRLWRSIPYEPIKDFFHEYNSHRSLLHADSDYLFAWLDALQESLIRKGSKLSWDVLLVSLEKVPDKRRYRMGGIEIGKQDRTVGGRIERVPGQSRPSLFPYDPVFDDLRDAWRIGSKQRVASRGIEKAPLSDEVIATVREGARIAGEKNVPDLKFRRQLERPLLMLHVLDLYADKDHDAVPVSQDVAAWGASFPAYGDLEIQAREYTVNKVWLEQFGPARDAEEEEED